MKFKKIIFLIKPGIFFFSMILGAYAVLWIEKVRPSDFGFYKDIFTKEVVIKTSKKYPLNPIGQPLTQEDMEAGIIAWKYFQNNYQEKTGLVNSVDKYTATTFWDITSYGHGLLSAYEINIIDSTEMDVHLTKLLTSLSSITLFHGKLPNKVYNTKSLKMIDYGNNETKEGIGWSAMDIGRFFSFAYRIMKYYPQYTGLMEKVTDRWQINEIVDNATLYSLGFNFKDKSTKKVQEGKLGYEEYVAKGYNILGYDVSEALKYTDFIKFVNINGIEIATDTREVKTNPAFNYILSEPYMLDGLEYGWDVNSRELSYRVYEAQKKRYQSDKIITAVSETHLDTIPYFVYNSVYADGDEWNCLSESGEDANEFKTLSTKAAFTWHTFYNDDYSKVLRKAIEPLADINHGWYSGIYEKTGKTNKVLTANTNGIILECLRYKAKGPLLRDEKCGVIDKK